MLRNQKLKLLILICIILFAACSSKEYADRLHYFATSDPNFKSGDKSAPTDLREYLIDLRTEGKTNDYLFLLAQTPPDAEKILFMADPGRNNTETVIFYDADKETNTRSISVARARIGKSDVEFKFDLKDQISLSARLVARARIVHEETKLYSYRVSWPEFSTSNAALNSAINAVASSLAQGENLADFIKIAKTDRAGKDPDMTYELELGYTVTFLNDRFVSVLFTGEVYTGGAHPDHWMDSIVFAINGDEVQRIELNGYVINGDKQDDLVSLMRDKLRDQKASLTDDFVPDDATFTFVPGGIQFWFNQYIAGPYAEGAHKIFVSWDELKPYLAPELSGGT